MRLPWLPILLASCGGARTPAPGPAERVQIRCRDVTLEVEVAADEATRERGLMNRRSLGPDAGMLFVFPTGRIASFWMKDTYLPLSIAFIDETGRIESVDDMAPFDEQTYHHSQGLVRYALEMNQGWFAQRGVGPGDTCDLRAVEGR